MVKEGAPRGSADVGAEADAIGGSASALPAPAGRFHFIGNLLCLDLVNTEVNEQGRTTELLASFADLTAWLVGAGVLSGAEAEAALRRWEGTQGGAAALEHARALRRVLRRMVERIVAGEPIGEAPVEAINALLASRVGYPQLVRTEQGLEMRVLARGEAEAEHLLVPVAESAAGLLLDGDLSLVRRCEHPACILYFYDTSRNRSRRWCSMELCGSRSKAAAYYRRTRRRRGS